LCCGIVGAILAGVMVNLAILSLVLVYLAECHLAMRLQELMAIAGALLGAVGGSLSAVPLFSKRRAILTAAIGQALACRFVGFFLCLSLATFWLREPGSVVSHRIIAGAGGLILAGVGAFLGTLLGAPLLLKRPAIRLFAIGQALTCGVAGYFVLFHLTDIWGTELLGVLLCVLAGAGGLMLAVVGAVIGGLSVILIQSLARSLQSKLH
jgi:hypothetical protein